MGWPTLYDVVSALYERGGAHEASAQLFCLRKLDLASFPITLNPDIHTRVSTLVLMKAASRRTVKIEAEFTSLLGGAQAPLCDQWKQLVVSSVNPLSL